MIDEWDEEFDRGKVRKNAQFVCRPVNLEARCHSLELVFRMNEQVKKMKSYKREKWRSGNIFQKIQDRRSKWSVTPGGKRVFGVRR